MEYPSRRCGLAVNPEWTKLAFMLPKTANCHVASCARMDSGSARQMGKNFQDLKDSRHVSTAAYK